MSHNSQFIHINHLAHICFLFLSNFCHIPCDEMFEEKNIPYNKLDRKIQIQVHMGETREVFFAKRKKVFELGKQNKSIIW